MIEIYALRTFLQINTHQALGICLRRSQRSGMLLPFIIGNGDALLGNDIILRVNQLYANLSLLAIDEMKTAIYSKERFSTISA